LGILTAERKGDQCSGSDMGSVGYWNSCHWKNGDIYVDGERKVVETALLVKEGGLLVM